MRHGIAGALSTAIYVDINIWPILLSGSPPGSPGVRHVAGLGRPRRRGRL